MNHPMPSESTRQSGLLMSLLVLCGGILPSAAAADTRALVPAVSATWRDRLIATLEASQAGDGRRATEGLRRALQEGALQEGRSALVWVPRHLGESVPELLAEMRATTKAEVRSEDDSDSDEVRRVQRAIRRSGGGLQIELPDGDISGRALRVATLAEHILRHLPEAQRALWRRTYESPAQARLEAAKALADAEELARVAREFPMTAAGWRAREQIADAAYEASDWRRAAALYRDCAEARLPTLATKESRAGFAEVAARRRGALKFLACQRWLGATAVHDSYREGWTRTEDALLADDASRAALERIEASITPSAPAPLPQVRGDGQEVSWISAGWGTGFRLPVEARHSSSGNRFDMRRRGVGSLHVRGRLHGEDGVDYPMAPAVWKDEIFLTGLGALYRIDARPGTGKLLEEISKPLPLQKRRRAPLFELSDSPVYTVTLATRDRSAWNHPGPAASFTERVAGAGRTTNASFQPRASEGSRLDGFLGDLPTDIAVTQFVATNTEYHHYMRYDITVPVLMRSLAAFDLESGRVLWKTDDLAPVSQTDPYGPNQVPVTISYTSPALVRGDRVYVGGWKDEGFVNTVVRALDLRTGETVWETPICSAQMELTMFGEMAREPFASFLLESAGVLYYASNLGGVAAIEADTGSLLWVTAYDYIEPHGTLQRQARKRDLVWGLNPPLLIGHVLVVAPRDGDTLLAIDTGRGPAGPTAAGRLLWKYDNRSGDLRDLLGVAGDRLWFTGPSEVAALDLSTLPAGLFEGLFEGGGGEEASEKRDGSKRDAVPEPDRLVATYAGLIESIPAAGLLTDQGVVYAERDAIGRINFELDDRQLLVDGFPKPVQGRVEPGRVFLIDGRLLVAGRHHLTAFSEPLR